MEGRRALVTEVQALIGADRRRARPGGPSPASTRARLAMVLAVLQRRTERLTLHDREVFAATVGGIRVIEPAADLAMALAVASGGLNLAIAPHLVAIGEVGPDRRGPPGRRGRPGGWPRRPGSGFRFALVPPGCGPAATGVSRRACG